jgi:4-amino-4-deoxy-L-arabinose transferase-like glycosyltransferase
MDTKTVVAVSRPAPRFLRVLLIGCALAGALAVMAATRWGIGTSPDSVTYLGVADNVQHGLGWTVPFGPSAGDILTQYPPLYPALLALSGALAGDLGIGARGLQALLAASNILLVAAFIMRVGGGWWAPFVGAALVVTAPLTILIHSMAWSEPLFIFLGFSGMLVLARGLEEGRAQYYWASAVLFGLACLARLVGVALLLTGVIGILLEAERPKRRILRAAIFGIGASLPLLAWLFWSGASVGSLANRSVGIHLVGREQLQQSVGTMATWLLLPGNLPGLIKALFLVIAGLGIIALIAPPGRWGRGQAIDCLGVRQSVWPREIRLVAIFFPAYLGVLAVATSFLDANVPWDDRILSSLFVSAVVLGTTAIGRAVEKGQAPKVRRPPAWVRTVVFLFVCLWVAGYATRSAAYLEDAYADGLGFRHQIWRESETMARLDTLPASTQIYSNSPDAIYLYTGRAARPLPVKELRMPHRANPDFPVEVAAMRQALAEHGGAIVYFDAVPAVSYPTVQELNEALGPVRVDRAADGVILTLPTVAARP